MPIIKTPCPDCNGKVHLESFYGNSRNNKAYLEYSCAGDTVLRAGSDGSRKSGCGKFRARKSWNTENIEETKSISLKSNEIDSWAEWENRLEKYNET